MPGYLGTILFLTAAILALPLLHSWEHGVATIYLVLLGLIGAIPASDLAIALVNRAVTTLLGRARCRDWNCSMACRNICGPSSWFPRC